MANRVNKFLELINQRDEKMEEHCKDISWAELCNYPEERDWYTKNIFPLDQQIVSVANGIIAKFSIPCKEVKTVRDVYSNYWLLKFVEKNNNAKNEDSLSK